VIGLFLGLGLAKALNALFVSLGIDLPQVGTVFKERTVVVALLVGVIVTLIAAIRPALRATKVEPIAAVREGAVLPRSRLARFGPYIAIVVIALSVGLMLVGLFVGGLSTKVRLLSLGVGALAVFVGVAMLAPTLVPPIARFLGWPAMRWGGAAGRLARGNSIRNPSRTASTASALMIGVTLVTLVSVLAAGIKSTFEDSVNKLFTADYALTSQNGFTPSSIASEKALTGVAGVEVVSGVRAGEAEEFGGWQDSVHLCDFPEPDASLADSELEFGMDAVRRTIELGRDSEGNPQLPDWIQTEYSAALSELAEMGSKEILDASNVTLTRSILAILAIQTGARTSGHFLLDYEEDELLEMQKLWREPRSDGSP